MSNEESTYSSLAVLERLLELATQDQQRIKQLGNDVKTATDSLKRQAATLRSEVDKQVSDKFDSFAEKLALRLSDKLKATYDAANNARIQYETTASEARSTVKNFTSTSVWLIFGAGALSLILFATLLFWYMPSYNDISNRRAELSQLQEGVDRLRAAGGEAVIATCDGKPCVRVASDKPYGQQGGPIYYIIQGQ